MAIPFCMDKVCPAMSTDITQATGLTLRSPLIGCAMVVIISLGAPYSIWTFGSTEITWSFFPTGVGFLFVCLIFLNTLLKKINIDWALRPAELITIVAMGLGHHRYPGLSHRLFSRHTDYILLLHLSRKRMGYLCRAPSAPLALTLQRGRSHDLFFKGLPIGEPTS